MLYIGRIDRDRFYGVANRIITDEVVLTDKQQMHIKERHPGILEKFEKYFPEILSDPDYILKDKTRENTAIILKTVEKRDEEERVIGNLSMVLKLAVEDNEIHNKNSIITVFPIGKNRMKSYNKNGEIIYKKE